MFDRYTEAHRDEVISGRGDARPPALQIVRDNDLLGRMSDKVILITGCSSDIGIKTARALKATGVRLYLTGRDPQKRPRGTRRHPGSWTSRASAP